MIDRACISLNAKCNLKCSYCHFSEKKNNDRSFLNEFTNDEILIFCNNLKKYIKDNNIKYFKLGIVGAGEPLLSFSQLKTLVEFFYFSDIRSVMNIYTISNGTLLSKEIVDFFFEYKDIIELNISIDGDYKINMKYRGCFPKVDIYKNKFGYMPKINTVVTKELIQKQDIIFNFYKKKEFDRINFSKVFGCKDPNIRVSEEEYESFLKKARLHGIISRQNIKTKKYDCAKYGKLCGVGRNNVFICKTGVYPCGRFMDNHNFLIGKWDNEISLIEDNLHKINPCPDGKCYYEFNKVGI